MAATKAQEAVIHILLRMERDGRLAYLIGPGSESYRLLIEAEAERTGKDPAELGKSFGATLRPERIKTVED